MSPVPPEPTASSAPHVPSEERNNIAQADASAESDLPQPTLRLELRDLRNGSIKDFLSNIDSTTDISKLVETVIKQLYYPSSPRFQTPSMTTKDAQPSSSTPSVPRSRPAPRNPHIPGTRSVTLVLRSMEGVAYTTGLELDDDHKEIHFSLSYIAHVASSNKGDSRKIRKELMGVICHELVHCYQWNGRGSAPGGLIEGIADWVRLQAGFVPPHWKREAGKDVSWDAGYQTTGYFLNWLEDSFGEGSVRRINEALGEREYKEEKFWKTLFGKPVTQLWELYGEELRKQEANADGTDQN